MSAIQIAYYKSPIGTLAITHNDEFILSIAFVESEETESRKPNAVLRECLNQLDGYFEGTRQQFDLPLAPIGTTFQKRVWRQLQLIPYANKISYQTLAKAIGDVKSSRAVGAANGKNPIAIVIPCHRVIAGDESLTGYAWGIARKQWLLTHEAKFGLGIQTLF